MTVNGQEETISEYVCDWPDCSNVAVHVLGVIRELRASSVVCEEHAAMIAKQKHSALRSTDDPQIGSPRADFI